MKNDIIKKVRKENDYCLSWKKWVIGNLSPKQITGKKKGIRSKYQKNVNRGVHNTSHLGRFIKLLTYKAK